MYKLIGGLGLWILGWKATTPLPAHIHKYIVLTAPHTSNWDFLYGFLSRPFLNLKPGVVRFLAKSSLFKGIGGWFFHNVGGLPVYRDANRNLTEQIGQYYDKLDKIGLSITPEGTRGLAEKWKTGFWYIAKRTNAPVVLGFIDYYRREVGVGPIFELSDNVEKDIADIQKFYRDKMPRYREYSNIDHADLEIKVWPNRIATYARLGIVLIGFFLLYMGIVYLFDQ